MVDLNYRAHSFTGSGSFVVTWTSGETLEYLVIAGGGGGGCQLLAVVVPVVFYKYGTNWRNSRWWRNSWSINISICKILHYLVGAGGAGAVNNPGTDGTQGDNSVFDAGGTPVSGGGGFGAGYNRPGGTGGSGGGGTRSGSGVQVTIHQSHHLREMVVVVHLIRQTIRMVVAAVVLALPVVLVMDLVATVFEFLGFHQRMEHHLPNIVPLDGSLVVVAVVLKLLLRAVMVALVVAAVADLEAYLVRVAVVPVHRAMVEELGGGGGGERSNAEGSGGGSGIVILRYPV